MPRDETIARVECREPPETVRTVDQWLRWRESEDRRMLAELLAQVRAHFEREAGATCH